MKKNDLLERLDLDKFISEEISRLAAFALWWMKEGQDEFHLSTEEWVDRYNEFLAGRESGEL